MSRPARVPLARLLLGGERPRRARDARRTRILAGAAAATTAALAAAEGIHIWRRSGGARQAAGGDVLGGGRLAAQEAAAVIREGYRQGSANETAVLNLFLAFGATWAAARGATHAIHRGVGPFRNVVVGRRHIHHFVPGLLLAFAAGGASIALRHEDLDHLLAIPFGAGVALVLDESALLLELEDVYWSEKGVVSVQITLGAAAMLASLALIVRLLRRGGKAGFHPAAGAPGPYPPPRRPRPP